MADSKISDLTALTTQASGDLLPIVDVSEAAAADKNKSITVEELFRGIPVSVGIGTSTLSNVLHVHQTDASANSYVHITQADGGSGATDGLSIGIEDGGVNAVIRNRENGYLRMYTNDEERLRIDSSGRVGIGTTSVNTTLEVRNSSSPIIRVGDGTRHFQVWGGSSTQTAGIGTAYASAFAFNVDSSEVARIDSSGRVGIGVTSPISELHVENSTQAHISVKTASSNMAKFGSKGNDVYIAGTSGSANVIFKRNVTSIDHPADSGTETLRIDSFGRLLLGTSTALANIKRYATSAAPPQQISTATQSWNNGLSLVNYSSLGYSPVLTFGTSLTNTQGANTLITSGVRMGTISFNGNDGTDFEEGARIEVQADGTPSSTSMPGRMLFYTTSAGSVSPTERMRISNGGQISQFSDTGWENIRVSSASAAGTTRTFFSGYYSATAVNTGTLSYRVYTNGNVQNTNNSYGAISDAKLKENIVDASSQWDDLKAIQVRKYNFKEGQTHTQLGVVAQEVELVSPGLVTESPDIDGEGNDLGTTTKSVNYSVLYMKAVKALQEAMERIETLEAKVAALESA